MQFVDIMGHSQISCLKSAVNTCFIGLCRHIKTDTLYMLLPFYLRILSVAGKVIPTGIFSIQDVVNYFDKSVYSNSIFLTLSSSASM